MLWSFEGRLPRLPYVLIALTLFFSQHLVTWAVFKSQDAPFVVDWTTVLIPLRTLLTGVALPNWGLLAISLYAVALGWALAAATFRRATDAGKAAMAAALVLAPVLQVAVIVVVSVLPTVLGDEQEPGAVRTRDAADWRAAVCGVLLGTPLTVVAVFIGALIFGSYGYGVFVVTPFVIGAVAAYVANRDGDIGAKATRRVALLAIAAGGLALVVTALEGIICIVMAAPLAVLLALLGGMLGRQTLASVALLPLVFVGEVLLPPAMTFVITERIEIAATPEAIWAVLLDHDMSREPVTLPYRLGLAHPRRGYVVGEGVGALRYGEFSTGTAVERVTAWQPARRLAFAVVKDVPAMHELSPYDHVHAPHAVGYFNTDTAGFTLRPLGAGRTELEVTSSHTLKLDPVLYWLPLARLAVQGNNRRVLAHLKRQAESAASRPLAAYQGSGAGSSESVRR
jgi:uncharacterized membrane protein YhaH (DUF805 family)